MNVPSVSGIGSLFPISSIPRIAKASRETSPVPAEPDQTNKSLTTKSSDLSALLPQLGLGELDSLARSAQAFRLESSRSEFNVQGEGFRARGITESFRLDATFQQGDSIFQLSVSVERSVLGVALNSAAGAQNGSFDELFNKLYESLGGGDGSNDVFQRINSVLENAFSPEATANRISDFALLGFGQYDGGSAASENSTNSRQRFVDFILPAIDKGFRDARNILGELDKSVSDGIDKTHGLIVQRLQDFVQNGSVPQPTEAVA